MKGFIKERTNEKEVAVQLSFKVAKKFGKLRAEYKR